MPQQTEPSANNALGGLLQGMLSRSRVHSENTQAIAGHAGLQPDVLVITPGAAPVVVEAEFDPASNVETEAKNRLGLEVASNGRVIEAVIALRYPEDVRDAYDLRAALKSARLSYCVFTEETDGAGRFPASGWLEGSVEDLADMVRLVSVPQRAVDTATNALQEGIDRAASVLDELDETKPGINMAIANLLGMTNVPQTRRMACAIVANAMVFHEHIAGIHPEIKPLASVCGPGVANPQGEVLAAWDAILGINYWAIFAIARDLVQRLDALDAARILRQLRDTAQSVNAAGVDNAHDLTGRIFQKLIADRKYLATFYTLPASAALLARLAVAKLEGVDWSDAEAICRLRVGDFACGTGALLSAVYEQIAARHERAGGNPRALHKAMMEEVLYGCDVMPSAIHITGSTLSGVEPTEIFQKARLYTFAYGRRDDGSVRLGSLELLRSSSEPTLFNTSEPAQRTGSAGEETAAQAIAEVPDDGFDLVIMNPPFTRNVTREGAYAGTVAAAFAAFGASDTDQRQMATRMQALKAVRVSDYALSQAASELAHSKLWLPGFPASDQLAVAPLGAIGNLGTYHLDIIGRPPRGPFSKVAPSPTATYPSLWNHNANNESRMGCAPDSQLEVRQGLEDKAGTVWAGASRAHLNLDFTFGAQPLAVAFTDTKTIGGRVWPNVSFADNRCDYAFAVWGNSTLGLLSYWWHSSRQQSSKASITIRSAETLPVLDFRALIDKQLAEAEAIFEEFRGLVLKPAYLADADKNRALLDRRVVCDLLGFDEETYVGVRRLAAKWCAEPSVHGGKARPRGAGLVV